MNVTATLAARVLLSLTGTPVGDLTPSAYVDTTQELNLTNGTTSFELDQVLAMSGTLAAGGTIGLDLSGSRLDVFGGTVTITKMAALALVNTSPADGTGGNLRIKNTTTLVDGAGSNQHFNLGPQGFNMIADPSEAGLLTVTPGTSDLLVLENNHSANVTSYTLHIVGRSV